MLFLLDRLVVSIASRSKDYSGPGFSAAQPIETSSILAAGLEVDDLIPACEI
jgi:hypothetical protein